MYKYMFFLCLNLMWTSTAWASDDLVDKSANPDPSTRECLQEMVLEEPEKLTLLTGEQQHPDKLADLRSALKLSCIQNRRLSLLVYQQEQKIEHLEEKNSELKTRLQKLLRFNASKKLFLEHAMDNYNILQGQYAGLQEQSNARAAQDAATIDDLKKQIELLKAAAKPE